MPVFDFYLLKKVLNSTDLQGRHVLLVTELRAYGQKPGMLLFLGGVSTKQNLRRGKLN